MKKITKTPVKTVVIEEKTEIIEEDGGLITLLGKRVCLMCMNYIYVGTLMGVNTTCLCLEDAGIVYSTGDWSLSTWKDFQKLPAKQIFVNVESVESFFEAAK